MIQMIQNRLSVTFFYLRSTVTQNKSDSSGTCVIVSTVSTSTVHAVVVPSPSSKGPLVQGVLKHQIR